MPGKRASLPESSRSKKSASHGSPPFPVAYAGIEQLLKMTSVRRTSETTVGHAPPKACPLPPAFEVALRGDTHTEPGCRREGKARLKARSWAKATFSWAALRRL